MKIHDITHTLTSQIAVWPGDQPFQKKDGMTMDDGYSCNVSSVTLSMHTGTHTDSHYHYNQKGESIEKHQLQKYMGSCQVIHVMDSEGDYIEVDDIKGQITEKRVLFRTSRKIDINHWNNDFKGLSVALINYLNELGVVLVGTDSPSVDLFESKDLKTHHALYQHDMYNLESIKLEGIEEGIYDLVALPLKVEGADGSPVRAVLIEK